METLEVPEHAHPLKLIDLQLQYEEDKEDDVDEDGNPITKEEFQGVPCNLCGEEINIYHRYCYTCTVDHPSCDFTLHKFCAELSTTLVHELHQHPITRQLRFWWTCKVCEKNHTRNELCYSCSECNYFTIDVKCAVDLGKIIIHHPSHPHLLMCAIRKPILCKCSACGREHKGIFYHCATKCTSFTIHSDCAFLPKTLLIQHSTNGAFHHTHPLTISYSFPQLDQFAKHYPRCRICGVDFHGWEYHWMYKCDKCMYYAHLKCAIRVPPAGAGQTIKDYKDEEYPDLLHLPFPDETYSLPKHLFFKENGSEISITSNDDEVSLQHTSHQHPLIFVQMQRNRQTSSKKINTWLLMCHDPMKKTQLQCNGCLRPIMATMPFYRCAQGCNFALHEWCTRLPQQVKNHPGHPQHTLLLIYSNALPHFFKVFDCAVCSLPCNGFAYGCEECGYYVDVSCGFLPKQITHESHPNHLLSISVGQNRMSPILKMSPFIKCPVCWQQFNDEIPTFCCKTCYFFIHPACALLLPKAIRHKYDKHPMHLSYLPIENHKSEYFCEICEEDLNPHAPFYHCKDCAFSMHAACSPLILRCETHTHGMSYNSKGIYFFVNIKFGGIYNTYIHPHPLLFAQGILSDGECSMCGETMVWTMIFKCLKCKFGIHYRCCPGFFEI